MFTRWQPIRNGEVTFASKFCARSASNVRCSYRLIVSTGNDRLTGMASPDEESARLPGPDINGPVNCAHEPPDSARTGHSNGLTFTSKRLCWTLSRSTVPREAETSGYRPN